MESKQKKMSYRLSLLVAGTSTAACALLWLSWGIYLYWDDARLVNFLAAWIPSVLSVLVAFVPEHEMTPVKKILWRSSVIAVGFAWSVVLWHQQVVTDIASKRDQQNMVAEAVSQSNSHSDEQIGFVRQDVKGVKADLAGTASKTDLTKTATAITGSVAKSQAELSVNIGKINKPDPPEQVRLQFSLFVPETRTDALPILTHAVSQGKDGNFPVDLFVTNISNTAGEAIDIWIQLCDLCSFAAEPAGFDKPQGLDERARHRLIPLLNPGVSLEKQTIVVKSTVKAPFSFTIVFRYSCKACGKQGEVVPQTVVIVALPYALAASSLYSRFSE